MAYQARTSQNLKFYMGDGVDYATSSWELIPGIRDYNGPNFSKPEIDATTLASQAKEYVYDIPDAGTITFNGFFDDVNDTHFKMVTETIYSYENTPFKVEFPTGTLMYFRGNLTGMPVSGGVGAVNSTTFTFRISGNPTWVKGGTLATIEWDSTLVGVEADGTVTGTVVGNLTQGSGSIAKFTDIVTDGSDFGKPSQYTITGVPTGLVPKLTKTSSMVATLSFTGAATNKKDVSAIRISFNDSAFDNASSDKIMGSTKEGIAITFA